MNKLVDEVKEAMKASSKTEISEEVIKKINEIKEEFLKIIPELAEKYDNEIPFTAIKEASEHPYQIISDVLLNLIMENKLTAFINDGGTEALDDDVLIVRKERFVDSLEVEYETGYAE